MSSVSRGAFLQKTLTQRAAFDLKCGEKEVTLSDLGVVHEPAVVWDGSDHVKVDKMATTQGASGCGRQATYVYVDGKWVMNAQMFDEK